MITLHKCLIANRGEIAVRIIRACRELGIASAAVYSDADSHALHTRLADEAHHIGESSPAASYLNTHALIVTALHAGCDCLHPGYGFLSENADFVQQVLDSGLTWIGPSPSTIRAMGVKTEARALMQSAGVPVVPGFQSDTASEDDLIAAAHEIGYPLMVKAAGGGGGKGIRVVRSANSVADAITSARREALNAFGDPRLFLERYVEAGHHIEAQIVGDTHGNIVHLFERECSVQRRHQKIIEESPSPLLTAETRYAVGQAAVAAARAVDYVSAGTVEFIADRSGQFYFLEMNTRLQVEHPVTEMITGLDLVRLQFMIAARQPLPFAQTDLRQHGHAIECRLYAEDPASGFLPATGTILKFAPPFMPGVRIDAGVESGSVISHHYDPMIAKVIAHASTRADAIARLKNALRELVLLGPETNRAFLLALLDHPDFAAGRIHTAYIDAHLSELLPAAPDLPDAALIALALEQAAAPFGRAVDSDQGASMADPWSTHDGFRLRQRAQEPQ